MLRRKDNAKNQMERRKKRMKHPLRLLGLLALAVYVTVLFFRQEVCMYAQQKQIASLNEQITQENDAQAKLREDIAFCRSDEYTEIAAREKLGWIRKDEILFIGE